MGGGVSSTRPLIVENNSTSTLNGEKVPARKVIMCGEDFSTRRLIVEKSSTSTSNREKVPVRQVIAGGGDFLTRPLIEGGRDFEKETSPKMRKIKTVEGKIVYICCCPNCPADTESLESFPLHRDLDNMESREAEKKVK